MSITKRVKKPNKSAIPTSLAEHGKMNKWDIKEVLKIQYPRVHEAVTALEKEGFVQKIGKKKIRSKLDSPVYSLTFKGALAYLASMTLQKPRQISNLGESTEEFIEQIKKGRQRYLSQLRKLLKIFKRFGEDFNYEIFKQIDWLLENFNVLIFDLLLRTAKNQEIEAQNLFTMLRKREEIEERDLLKRIEIMEKNPFLQKLSMFMDVGKGKQETGEIDLLAADRIMLEQNRRGRELSIKNESDFWKQRFAYNFFEDLAHFPKKKENKNEPLKVLAETLLQRRKKTLFPLERVIAKFDGGD